MGRGELRRVLDSDELLDLVYLVHRQLQRPGYTTAVLSRRRLLFLLGSAAPGLWLGGTGLLRLQRRFVLELGGRCSFCGKSGTDVASLAGVVTRAARICDECIGLCCQILAEASLPVGNPSRIEEPAAEDELDRLLRELDAGQPAPFLETVLADLRRRLNGDRPARVLDLRCAFCDGHRRDVAKLISGPRVFICDACVGDAAALTSKVLRA